MLIELQNKVQVGKHHVIGYDVELQSPVLEILGTRLTLDQARRVAWDDGEEDAFNQEELKTIEEAVSSIKRQEEEAKHVKENRNGPQQESTDRQEA